MLAMNFSFALTVGSLKWTTDLKLFTMTVFIFILAKPHGENKTVQPLNTLFYLLYKSIKCQLAQIWQLTVGLLANVGP